MKTAILFSYILLIANESVTLTMCLYYDVSGWLLRVRKIGSVFKSHSFLGLSAEAVRRRFARCQLWPWFCTMDTWDCINDAHVLILHRPGTNFQPLLTGVICTNVPHTINNLGNPIPSPVCMTSISTFHQTMKWLCTSCKNLLQLFRVRL